MFTNNARAECTMNEKFSVLHEAVGTIKCGLGWGGVGWCFVEWGGVGWCFVECCAVLWYDEVTFCVFVRGGPG